MIVFSKHAKEKFDILAEHGFLVTKEQVRRVVENPARLDHSRSPLVIAQASFDAHRVLRVVFKYEAGRRKIITFYPGRKKQYEKN